MKFCFIFINGGDVALQKAVEVLKEGGIASQAKGWGTGPAPHPRAQVQIKASDFDRAKSLLAAAAVNFIPLSLNESLLEAR